MKKVVIITAIGLFGIFLLLSVFNMLTGTKPAGNIEGLVVAKTGSTITIKKPDGSEKEIPVTDFKVGEKVDISIYKNELTGKTEYRYFITKAFSAASE